jgi:Predicted acyltransferases
MVYLHHLPFLHHFAVTAVVPPALLVFTNELHVGVGLFFVLSGFLIYRRYATSVDGSGGWWYRYGVNRVARIYPMYFLFTAITFLILREHRVGMWALHLTMLRGFSDVYKFTGIGQGWSLTVEECFYFSAPLLFLWLRKSRHFWPALFVVYGAGLLLLSAGHAAAFLGFFDGWRFMSVYTFFGRAFEFFAGMFVARLLIARPANGGRPIVTYGSIATIGVTIELLTRLQGPKGEVALLNSGIAIAVNNFIIAALFAALIYALVAEYSMVHRILGSRLAVLLGRASYVFYLIHMGPFREAIQRRLHLPTGVTEIAVMFIVMNVIAVLAFLIVEEPLNRAVRAILGTGRREPSDGAPAPQEEAA